MAEQFKPGDTVALKSGGPLMTVESIQEDGSIVCHWFDNKQELRYQTFKSTSIEPDDPRP